MEQATREVSVRTTETAADDVRALELEPTDGGPVEQWSPGAHIDVHLPGGLVRQYSLCGDPADTSHYRVAVLREPDGRGGSITVHEKIETGTVLTVGSPRNNFALVESSRYLFVAGGIGITPLIPMIREVAAAGADWHLLYGGRRRDSMAFVEELAEYGDRVSIRPQDEFGLLELEAWLGASCADTAVYCCGPAPLLEAVEALSRDGGSLRTERFSAGLEDDQVEDDAVDEADIICDASGVTVHVEKGQTVLEALRSAGVTVPTSCEEGVCGTCETAVLDGCVAHRDSILSDEERADGDVMMVCVSRPASDSLTLDI